MIIDRAISLCSPVISASDPGNRSMIKGLSRESQIPRQLCDVVLQIKRDLCVVNFYIIIFGFIPFGIVIHTNFNEFVPSTIF